MKTTTIEAAPEEKPAAKRAEPRNSIAEWAVTILFLLFGTTSLAQPFVIPTGSMEDNLLVGDHLIVDKLAYSPSGVISKYFLPYSEPKHGDVIVFRYPADITQTYIKRLIGAPGDRIRITNGVVFRNGQQLNEPYVFHKFTFDSSRDNFPAESKYIRGVLGQQFQEDMLRNNVVNHEVVVPAGNYFAMGDNRDNSEDSRYWGFVPRENIIGKPLLVYWSYRATTEELVGNSAGSVFSHMADVAMHFFPRTRWDRTLMLVRGVPDSALPSQSVPMRRGSPNP